MHELRAKAQLFRKFGAQEVMWSAVESGRQDEFVSTANAASGASFVLTMHSTA